jgi:hypothetical protein
MTLCFVFDRKRKTDSGQIVVNPESIRRSSELGVVVRNGIVGNFDPGDSMQTPQTNFHFSELDLHLKRLHTAASSHCLGFPDIVIAMV